MTLKQINQRAKAVMQKLDLLNQNHRPFKEEILQLIWAIGGGVIVGEPEEYVQGWYESDLQPDEMGEWLEIAQSHKQEVLQHIKKVWQRDPILTDSKLEFVIADIAFLVHEVEQAMNRVPNPDWTVG